MILFFIGNIPDVKPLEDYFYEEYVSNDITVPFVLCFRR